MNIKDGHREPQEAVWEVDNGATDPQVEWQKQDVTGGRRIPQEAQLETDSVDKGLLVADVLDRTIQMI